MRTRRSTSIPETCRSEAAWKNPVGIEAFASPIWAQTIEPPAHHLLAERDGFVAPPGMRPAGWHPEEARESLMSRFGFSEIQAQAILDMKLQRLTGLERDKIV